MSEKITFGELIESIAEETNHSKKFTHDFIKDFVDVINGGLEDDGHVNIAGFGKFALRRMEEREGYNPQTEEKITIPAHNKVVFKPYKDLRELVNAPYAHLEPELLEEDTTTDEESEDTDASDQDDFIPTAPPTSHQPSEEDMEAEDKEEAPFNLKDEITPLGSDSENKNKKDDEEDPFGLDDDFDQPEDESAVDDSDQDEGDEDNGDIIEFNAEEEENEDDFDIDNFINSIESSETESAENSDAQADALQDDAEDAEAEESVSETEEEGNPFNLDSSDEETEDDLNDFTGASEESGEETTEEQTVEDTSNAEEEQEGEKSRYAPNFEDAENTTEEEKDEKETANTPSLASKRHSRNRTSKMPIIAAAAVVLLLLAAGAWYFTTSSDSSAPEMATGQPTSTTEVADQQDDQQRSSANTESQTSNQQATQQNQQSQTSGSAETTQTAQSTDQESLKIEKGQTLWSIAEEKYGNPRLWPWIYGNNGSLKDPDLILAGNSLSVPLPSGPQNTLNATDSVGVAKGYLSTYRWYKNNQSSIARDHLWAAKSYYDNIRSIADIQIDKADLTYANRAR